MASTKVQAEALINELDLICRQIIDSSMSEANSDGQAARKAAHQDKLFELLHSTEARLNVQLDTARQQVNLERKLQLTREKINIRDKQLQVFLRRLKKSEQLLADTLHHAKEKLKTIRVAEAANVSTDELIRYSYIISQAGAIAAPQGWQGGDNRRPFPTELEMRCGILARFTENQTPKDGILSASTSQPTTLDKPSPHQKDLLNQIPPVQGDVRELMETTQKVWPTLPNMETTVNGLSSVAKPAGDATGSQTDNESTDDDGAGSDASSASSKFGWE